MSLRYIHYAFSSAGLPPAVAEKHTTFAARALAKRFELPLEAIHVVHRPRLPEDAPFQLSCYKGKSETCPLSMAVAAKIVLPHLRRARRHAVNGPALVQSWEPGQELLLDDEVLETLAFGVQPPSQEQVDWLLRQAASASAPRDKYARGAGGHFASGNRTRPALDLPGDSSALDIGQVAAALLKHRRDEVVALVAGGAK